MCTVAGYIGEFKFGNGGTSKHTYALECEGHYYPGTTANQKGAAAAVAASEVMDMSARLAHWRPHGGKLLPGDPQRHTPDGADIFYDWAQYLRRLTKARRMGLLVTPWVA